MPCFHPLKISNKSGVFTVPCGKCAFCLKQKRQNWVIRNLITLHNSTNPSYFITLTYDEEHCPEEISKRELQLFFKRFRKYYDVKNLKYFACGEYGSRSSRPHYHALLYNVPFGEQEVKECIQKCWQLGFVTVTAPNVARIKYTAKYILKGFNNTTIKKPFLLCSKGLGAEIAQNDAIVAHVKLTKNSIIHYGGLSYSLPKYVLNKMLNEQEVQEIQDEKKKYCDKILENNLKHHIRGDRHFLELQESHEEFVNLQLLKTKHNNEQI